jgi:hypothetical protein
MDKIFMSDQNSYQPDPVETIVARTNNNKHNKQET